jgi:phage terminase large subunit
MIEDDGTTPIMECQIPEAFQEFLQYSRFHCAYGGRGSGKTRTFITILVNNVLTCGWRVVAMRETMESIAESCYQEVVEEIERRNLQQFFRILKTHIECPASGGVFKFSGLRASAKRLDGQKLKGFSHFDAVFIDEAESVSKESFDALVPTMRKPESQIYVCFNPRSPLDFIYKFFVTERYIPDYTPDGKRFAVVRRVNFTENPFFPEPLAKHAEEMKVHDYETYKHVYLGEPVFNSDLAVIRPEWISSSVDAHIKLGITPQGRREGGFDVSDNGPDANALIFRQGIIALHAEEWRDKDPNSAASHAHAQCLEHRIELLRYDDIGVGAGAKGQFRQLQQAELDMQHRGFTRVQTEGFNAGGAVVNPDMEYMPGKINKDMFYNAKAQAWWLVADRFRNTHNAVNCKPHDPDKLISLSKDMKGLEKLCAELSQPQRDYMNGKVKVESKADMKKRGVPSPNLADALIMAYLETGANWSVWS